MKESGCLFCAIVAHREPAAFVLEAGAVVAFAALRQQVPGHILVVPRRHVETIYDLELADASALVAAAIEVARAVRAEFTPEGLSLWQSNGPAAFQEVPHVHLHVQPRWHGDGLLRVYPEAPLDSPATELEAIAGRVRQRLAAGRGETSGA